MTGPHSGRPATLAKGVREMVIEYDCPVPGWWCGYADVDGRVRLRHGDERVVEVGTTLTVPGPVEVGGWGLHAGRSLETALQHGDGSFLARVVLHPPVLVDACTMVAVSAARTTIWMRDMDRAFHAFAVDAAEWLLCCELAAGRPVPSRAWAAVAARRQWLAGALDWAAMERAHLDLYERDEPNTLALPNSWPDIVAASAIMPTGTAAARALLATVRYGMGTARLTPATALDVQNRLRQVARAAGAPLDDSTVLEQVRT